MGTELTTAPAEEQTIPAPPWLDVETTALARAIVATVASQHSHLRAAILYGSIARHDERPLTDVRPSDVDVLLLFDLDPGQEHFTAEQHDAIFHSIGLARDRHLWTTREVQVMWAVGDLEDWDPTFVENVARDGLLLWARGPLPIPLAAVAERPIPHDELDPMVVFGNHEHVWLYRARVPLCAVCGITMPDYCRRLEHYLRQLLPHPSERAS